MADEIILTEDNFEQEVINSEVPVLVDFWAEWCGPCKMLGPVIEEIATQYTGRAKVGKVNVDQNQTISGKYGIRSIPTLILFKNGEIVEQVVGAQSKQKVQELMDKSLG
jgi:thioredoxin 1